MFTPTHITALLVGVSAPAAIVYPEGAEPRLFAPLRGVTGDLDWHASFLARNCPLPLRLVRPPEPDGTGTANLKALITRTYDELSDGELLWLVLSGHGFQVPDPDHDELDGSNEAFATSDGLILDNFFRDLWARSPRADAAAVVFVDTCHADTLALQAERPLPPVGTSFDEGLPRIFLSASEQWERALEHGSAPVPRGYLTQALAEAWMREPEPPASYLEWFEESSRLVMSSSAQTPRIRYAGTHQGQTLLDARPLTA